MAVFPTAVATDADLLKANNSATSTIAAAVLPSDSTITVATGTGSRFSVNESIIIDNEIMLITAIATDVLTVTRGYQSTTATSHALNAAVSDNPTANHHNALKEEVKAIETALGASMANVLSTSGNYTLTGQWSFTNSTAPIITAKLGPSSSQQHSLPAVTSDTIALLNASQTLASKTLTTPTIASFVNANHDHSNSAGGGTIAHSSLTGLTSGDPHTQYILASGTRAFSGDQSFGGFKATSVGTPSSGTDAANKNYVDNLIAGLAWKQATVVATTANITLSGEQTIDGVTTSTSRVLVKNQSTQTENGIYVSAAGAWFRPTDADAGSELEGAAVFVQQGTVNANTSWTQTTDSVTIGSSNIVWVQFDAASLTAGDGLTRTGNSLAVDSSVARLTAVQTLTNKTLTTPTIGDFSNSTHSHQSNAGGGQLDGAAIASGTVADARIASALTGKTYNGLTVSTTTGTLTVTNGKTLSAAKSLTLDGTDGTTVTFQGSDTYVGRATADTFTNKTFDTAGTGNVFRINGTGISDKTGTGKAVLDTSPTLVTPVLGAATHTSLTGATVIGGTGASSGLTLQSTSGTGTSDFIKFAVGSNGATEAARITTSGSIGIGTTSPNVSGLAATTNVVTIHGSGEGAMELSSAATDGAAASIGEIDWVWTTQSANHKRMAAIYVESQGTTANQRGGEMTFYTKKDAVTGFSERMRITQAGNVGIGTSSVFGTLHVAASAPSITLDDTGGSTDAKKFNWYVQSGNMVYRALNDNNSDKTGPIIVLSGSGIVGVGTTTPGTGVTGTSTALHLKGILVSDTVNLAMETNNGVKDIEFRRLTVSDNSAVQMFSTSKPLGIAYIIGDQNGSAIFSFDGTSNAVHEMSDPSSIFSMSSGTGSSTNIYYSAGNGRYEIENKTGGTRNYTIWFHRGG